MPFLSRLWSRLEFLLRSTNHHGVHSPFVYRYLTRCLYRKGYRHRTKFQRIALKSIPYFDFRSVCIPGEHDLKKILSKEHPEVVYDRPPYDLIPLARGQISNVDLNRLVPLCHNDSAILVEDFRRTASEHQVWESLCEDPRITVSIDYYAGGILFFRKEQEKQHFRIRI
jgi:hypothetical protein